VTASWFGFFLLSIACLWAFAAVIARRIAVEGRDVVAVSILVLFTALYAIPLAAGSLGRLGPSDLLGGSLATIPATLLLARRRRASAVGPVSPWVIGRGHWVWSGVLAIFALVEAAHYARHFARVHPLCWDVAQFELPNAIRFAQLGTLWEVDPGFGVSYPYGYELSLIWPIVFTRSESLLGLMHALFCGAVVAYAYLVSERMLQGIPVPTKGLVSASVAAGLLVAPGFRGVFHVVGKADVAVAAFGLAAVYFLLRAAEGGGLRFFVLAGASLGLVVGTKATGLAYLAGFLAMAVLVADRRLHGRARVSLVVRQQLAILGPAVLLGGFWYTRNWLVVGNPTGDPGLARIGLERSIVLNLSRPAFYRFDGPFFEFATACLAGLAVTIIAVIRWRRGTADRVGFALFASALLLAVVTFGITPFSAHGTAPTEPLQLRLSGIMVPLLIIAAGLCLARVVGRRPLAAGAMGVPPFRLSLSVSRLTRAAWPLGGLVLLVSMVAQHFLYVPPDGLPGYERLLGIRERTQVYAWARRELHERSLLSLYVAPYGLLGPEFSNLVVYFQPEGLPIGWVRAAVARYGVEFVFVGKDPYSGQARLPPVAEAISREPGFVEAFRDSQVVVYRTPLSGTRPSR
jgi:hypothetical protein